MAAINGSSLRTASSASLAQTLQLLPGDVVKALVLALINDTTLRLQLPTGIIDIEADIPLAPGTRVELAVTGTDDQPAITLTPLPDAKTSRTGVPPAVSAQVDARPVAQPQVPLTQTESVAQTAATIVRNAATRQGGISQLFADLGASLTQQKVALPPPVVAAVKQLFAMRLDAASPVPVDADDIKAALARAGLVSAMPAVDVSKAPLDVRTVLLSLREALKNWETAERVATAPMPAGAPPPAAPTPTRQAGPALPYPNGPTVPQPAADPALPANASPRDMALHLLDKTDSAIAREMLLKIASLPERTEPATRPGDTSSTRMTFDIPLATPMGTSVAQLRIERDAAQRKGEKLEPVWRANFSVDVEPIGAVHVRISLVGGKAAVSFSAERAESAESLQAGLPLLEANLRKAELEPGALTCQLGQPVAASAEHGLYVDHAS